MIVRYGICVFILSVACLCIVPCCKNEYGSRQGVSSRLSVVKSLRFLCFDLQSDYLSEYKNDRPGQN